MAKELKSTFINDWALFARQFERDATPPYIFPGDNKLLFDAGKPSDWVSLTDNFEKWIEEEPFGQAEDKRLHLGLLPAPYIGHLSASRIFLLMLNPGLKPSSFYLEKKESRIREVKLRTLRQENETDNYPFWPLDPAFSFHPSADYWRKKFKGVLQELQQPNSKGQKRSYAESAQLLSKNVSCLQLVPYASKNFDLPTRIKGKAHSKHEGLASKQRVVEYVQNEVVPKAQAGKALIVAMRGVNEWGLAGLFETQPDERAVYFSGSTSRAAHLTTDVVDAMVKLLNSQDKAKKL